MVITIHLVIIIAIIIIICLIMVIIEMATIYSIIITIIPTAMDIILVFHNILCYK
jgi:hypothetical protein